MFIYCGVILIERGIEGLYRVFGLVRSGIGIGLIGWLWV